MSKRSKPDFTAFMWEFEMQIWNDFDNLQTETELRHALNKWQEPTNGILARVKDDPIYAMAGDIEQQVFQDYFAERLRMKVQYFRERQRNAIN